MALELARTLREVHRVANPVKPLASGDPRYVASTEVRGNEDVVERLFTTIDWAEEESHTHQLFTGHRGSGKSTELLRLQARLEARGYAVFYFEGTDDLDLNDVLYSDIILAIARRVTSGITERGITLDEKLLERVLNWFAETLYTKEDWREVKRTLESQAELGLSAPSPLPLIARLLARLTGQIHSGEQIRHTIRHQLDPEVSQLIKNTNLLLEEASAKLGKPIVVIVDNLDRITLTTGLSERTNHDAIYIDHGEQLTDLAAHLIYTVPISMFYSVKSPILTAIFPEYAVLPMIKSRDKDGSVVQAGINVLKEILSKRIDLDQIFTPRAVDYLCKMSGGHPRDLITLVRYSTRYALDRWPRPLNLQSAERAVGYLITEYNRAIPDEHYPLLAQIHLSKSISNDVIHRTMLHNQSVLEYYNGPPPWHDVHPVILDLPKFQAALQEARSNSGNPTS